LELQELPEKIYRNKFAVSVNDKGRGIQRLLPLHFSTCLFFCGALCFVQKMNEYDSANEFTDHANYDGNHTKSVGMF
jgi:hypothetical protein